MTITHWMSWEGGVDLVASTVEGGVQPNLIVHVARVVHTPVGSAASGMIFFQPDPNAPPAFIGFISTDPTVGAYFGPHIFAGTPFEHAPVLPAQLTVTGASARVEIEGFTIETELSELGELALVQRPLGEPLPFVQQGVEAEAKTVRVTINGEAIPVHLLPVGIAGGPSAVLSPTGVYAR